MIDKNNMDRIIGDYLEINSDIVAREFNSKLPEFISKWISKKQRKKLLSSLYKFRDSDYVLDWINLIELFTYVYNNFEPDHSYGVINNTVLSSEGRLEAFILFDNYQCLIYFDQLPINYSEEDIKFNLKMRNINANNGIDIYLTKLKGTSKQVQDMVSELNYVLKNTITEYIESTLKKYMEVDT